MLAIIFGLLFAICGIWGIVSGWSDFIIVLKGFVPFMFFCGGIIAIVVGISSVSDSLKAKEFSNNEHTINGKKKE